jgi:putative FmdB family regulatory protein
MPIYDFHCSKCGNEVEKMLKISESENFKCSKCGEFMKKIPCSKMTFQLVYDPKKHKSSWGSEGYSTTQRNRVKDEIK